MDYIFFDTGNMAVNEVFEFNVNGEIIGVGIFGVRTITRT